MRSLYACLGVVVVLTLCETASAQQAFTISKPPAANADRSLPNADEVKHSMRRTSSQQLIFRRATRAAEEREARIESRRRWGYSASRPNMVFDRPVVEWYGYGRWWMPHTATYYSRVR